MDPAVNFFRRRSEVESVAIESEYLGPEIFRQLRPSLGLVRWFADSDSSDVALDP